MYSSEQPFYVPLIQDNSGEPVLSQAETYWNKLPLEFYEPDIIPAAQRSTYSVKALQENPVVWSSYVS